MRLQLFETQSDMNCLCQPPADFLFYGFTLYFMGSRGDSSEQKLIELILEDSRAGTLARIIDHSDSNKDREQLVKNLGAIVIVQDYLGLRKPIGDIPIPDPGKENDPPEYKESVR
jgi:hypothetical protein